MTVTTRWLTFGWTKAHTPALWKNSVATKALVRTSQSCSDHSILPPYIRGIILVMFDNMSLNRRSDAMMLINAFTHDTSSNVCWKTAGTRTLQLIQFVSKRSKQNLALHLPQNSTCKELQQLASSTNGELLNWCVPFGRCPCSRHSWLAPVYHHHHIWKRFVSDLHFFPWSIMISIVAEISGINAWPVTR